MTAAELMTLVVAPINRTLPEHLVSDETDDFAARMSNDIDASSATLGQLYGELSSSAQAIICAQRDAIDQLNRLVTGLRARLAKVDDDNRRLDFAFSAAIEVVEDLKRQLGLADSDDGLDGQFDRSEVEALGATVIQ